MTVLKRRHRREDSDYDEVEVRVLLEIVGLCRNPSARNGDRDTIPYALADALEMRWGGDRVPACRFRRGLAERRRRRCPVRSASLLWTLAWLSA